MSYKELDLWALLRKIDKDPDDDYNNIDIARALISCIDERSPNWDEVYKRVMYQPSEASKVCPFTTFLPIHSVVNRSGPSPPLRLVKALVEAYPDALFNNENMTQNTPFFIACQNKHVSLDVVEFLLKCNKEALLARDGLGMIPLHVAKRPDVVKLLLENSPESVCREDYNSHMPLHIAVSNPETSSEVVRLLIEEVKRQNLGNEHSKNGGIHILGGTRKKRGLGLPIRTQYSPFKLALCFMTRHKISERLQFYDKKRGLLKPIGDVSTHYYVKNAWEKLCIVLMEATTISSNNLLVASIELNCPIEIIWLALCANPKYACERDNIIGGKTALMLAISKRMPVEILEIFFEKNYGCNEAACVPDEEGRLPLHVALENGFTFNKGIELILNAAPHILRLPDAKTKLYPFMLAAIGDSFCLDTTYALLQRDPSVLLLFTPNMR